MTRVLRGPFGSNDFSPRVWRAAQAGEGRWRQHGQTGRRAWSDRAAALTQFSSLSRDLASAPYSQTGLGVPRRRAGHPGVQSHPTTAQIAQARPLPSAVYSEPAVPWKRTGRGDTGPRLRVPHQPGGPEPTYLLRPRLRRSPQARILFWASMCVRPPAFSPSILSTQSPTATPACAALPPGVSCGDGRVTTAQDCRPN